MNAFTFFYIEANIFSIIISLIFVFREIKNVDKQIRNIEFLRSIIIYIIFYILDIIWALFDFDIYEAGCFQKIIIFLLLSSFAYGSYQWYIYSEVSQGNSEIYIKKNKIIWGIPIFVILSIFFVYMIYVCFNGTREILNHYIDMIHIFMILTAFYYEILTCVRSWHRAYKNRNNISKGTFVFMGISPIIFCSFIVLQAILINIPIFCFLNTIWMIFFYLRGIDDLISIDSLTKLNNRNQLRKYFHQLPHDKNENYLLVIDIDHFKAINDRYGHLEGDKALVLVSETFKSVCAAYPYKIFISRYGGDEFVIIAQASSRDDIINLKTKLNEKLEQNSCCKGLPYTLCISTGFTLITNTCENINQFIEKADKDMYIEKEAKYSKNCQ